MREPGSGTRQAFERVMHGIFPQLNIILELQHTEAIKRAVEAGLGIGCLSMITLEDAFERGSLVRLQLPDWNFERQLYLIIRKQKYLSTGIQSWMDYCLECEVLGVEGWEPRAEGREPGAGSREPAA